MDVLVTMFDDLRKQRPPVFDADGWANWIAAMKQVIQELPRIEQRWASVAMLANDLALSMGMPVAIAYRTLAPMLLVEADREQIRAQKGGRV